MQYEEPDCWQTILHGGLAHRQETLCVTQWHCSVGRMLALSLIRDQDVLTLAIVGGPLKSAQVSDSAQLSTAPPHYCHAARPPHRRRHLVKALHEIKFYTFFGVSLLGFFISLSDTLALFLRLKLKKTVFSASSCPYRLSSEVKKCVANQPWYIHARPHDKGDQWEAIFLMVLHIVNRIIPLHNFTIA